MRSQKGLRFWLIIGLVLFSLPHLECLATEELPPTPPPHEFIQDYASVIAKEDFEQIKLIQNQTFSANHVPIVIVTINSMHQYTNMGERFERLATRWFNHWGIGDATVNKGVLVLVSIQDRKARIELGIGWGRNWNNETDAIMENVLIPHFKRGEYSLGIRSTVDALAQMAVQEANGEVPKKVNKWGTFWRQLNAKSRMSTKDALLMVFLGIVLIVCSFYFKEYRIVLLRLGIVLIASAFVFWLVVLVAIIARAYRWGSGSNDGGFSGGSSDGGGGSSGSW